MLRRQFCVYGMCAYKDLENVTICSATADMPVYKIDKIGGEFPWPFHAEIINLFFTIYAIYWSGILEILIDIIACNFWDGYGQQVQHIGNYKCLIVPRESQCYSHAHVHIISKDYSFRKYLVLSLIYLYVHRFTCVVYKICDKNKLFTQQQKSTHPPKNKYCWQAMIIIMSLTCKCKSDEVNRALGHFSANTG